MTTTTKERIAELILRSVEQSIIDFDHVFDADPIATEIAAEIDALTAQLAEAQHDLKAAMEITEGAQNRRRDEIVANEKLHAQLAEARAQIAALTAQLAEARAQIEALIYANENKLVKVVYANGGISETKPVPESSPIDDSTVTISVDAKAKSLTPETRRRISKFVQGVQRNAGVR